MKILKISNNIMSKEKLLKQFGFILNSKNDNILCTLSIKILMKFLNSSDEIRKDREVRDVAKQLLLKYFCYFVQKPDAIIMLRDVVPDVYVSMMLCFDEFSDDAIVKETKEQIELIFKKYDDIEKKYENNKNI